MHFSFLYTLAEHNFSHPVVCFLFSSPPKLVTKPGLSGEENHDRQSVRSAPSFQSPLWIDMGNDRTREGFSDGFRTILAKI
jgi:hypothetical protein